MDVEFKVSEKDDNRIGLRATYTTEESAGRGSRKLCQRLEFVAIQNTRMSKDTEEKLKLVHKVINLTDGPNTKKCVCEIKWTSRKVREPEPDYLQENWKRKKLEKCLCEIET